MHRRATLAAQAQQLMAADPSQSHRLTHLAGALGVSPFHLAHVFRAQAGESLHQYLLRLRMELAIDRLQAGESSLSRLAVDLGFSSHSHFTAVFRKRFGASPAEMRSRLGERARR